MRNAMRRLGLLALGGFAVGAVPGCAEEREPINRVQPMAISKAFLVGADYRNTGDDPEFYARTMIIDVPFGAPSSMFANGYNKTTRIKWEIQESQLIGRVTYERLQGADDKGKGPSANDGQIAYVFPITSQFDIRRDYNPTTGEELNVVVENAADRAWMDRDYIRVDFSKNLNTSGYDIDSLALNNLIQGGVEYEAVGYTVTDSKDPNAPQIDVERGYFDVTDRVLAKPAMIKLPDAWGGGVQPACTVSSVVAGGNAPIGLCNAADLTLRHSFRKVTDTDYQPADWDGYRFQAFGAFTNDRLGYEREYGLVDKEHHRFVERYNVWERSHYYDDAAKMTGAVACKVDSECGAVADKTGELGSVCDTFKSKCTLPFRKRTTRPIVWHYQDKGDPIYFDATRDATTDWDTALRIATSASRYAECARFGNADGSPCETVVRGEIAEEDDAIKLVREVEACRRGEIAGVTDCNAFAAETGAKRAYSEAVVAIAQQAPAIVLCHSPVADKDAKECGERGVLARAGDLRYNLVSNIVAPNSTGYWGIMTDSNDPVTGEKVASSINVFTQPTERIAQFTVDVLRYIGGELKTADVTEGTYVDNWAEAAKRASSTQSVLPQMPRAELDKRSAAAFGKSVAELRPSKAMGSGVRNALMNATAQVGALQSSASVASSNQALYLARMNKAAGTPFEAKLLTAPMLQASGAASPAADVGRGASILGGMNPTFLREARRAHELGMAASGSCILEEPADTAPLSEPALGEILQAKFGKLNPNDSPQTQLARAERMRDFVRRRMHVGVIIHEMGHSFGLRHNFVSSSDAYNFRPQYWQLRTNDGQNKTACTEPTADGASCVGPRRFDPVTDNESKNMIGMWSQSSVMEYPGDSTQDFLSLGAYDFAAVRSFYGDVASVYEDPSFSASASNGKLAIDHQSNFGGILGITYHAGGSSGAPVHYSQLNKQLSLIRDCKEVKTADFKPANWDESKNGLWHPMLDGSLVTNETGKTTRCKVPRVDYVQWTSLTPSLEAVTAAKKPFQSDAKNRVRVPYGFASDEWADLGNLSVYRHDNGADAYELMNFWIAQQEVSHIFSNYRRGSATFSLRGRYKSVLERYHEKMRDAAKGLGLYVNIARDTAANFDPQDGDAFAWDVVTQVAPDLVIASSMAFDYFTHVYARPQPGAHGPIAGGTDGVLHSLDDLGFANGGAGSVSIPNGVFGKYGIISLAGRPLENALARNKGEYDREYTNNIGSYYEKAYTAMLFTESVDNFISSSRSDFYDPRFRNVSMADVFPDGFRRWLGNNLTNDEFLKGPRIAASSDGVPDVDTALLPKQGIGWTSWWPAHGIESCFPGPTTTMCRDPNDKNAPASAGPAQVMALDPQVGWEQQKFAIAMTLAYLPANQSQTWMNQINVWELGTDGDPGFENRIELHDPSGFVYIAKTSGTETLFGKTVQKGIAARVLEWANTLLDRAYQTTPITKNGVTWYVPLVDSTGAPIVKSPTDPKKSVQTCGQNPSCVQLEQYMSVPKFIREGMKAYGLDAELKGVY